MPVFTRGEEGGREKAPSAVCSAAPRWLCAELCSQLAGTWVWRFYSFPLLRVLDMQSSPCNDLVICFSASSGA